MKTAGKKKNTDKIKVGDKVFASKNPVWGLDPMTVTKVTEYGVTCRDRFGIEGCFNIEEVEPYSKARQSLINKLNKMENEVKEYKIRLFGKSFL